MKFKLLKIFVFIVLLIAADKAVGFICKKLYENSSDFLISKLKHTLDYAKEDVLVFGSSRAEYHFIPDIIKDSVGLSVYNCGVGGADLLFSEIQLNESLKKHKPRYIIIEASPTSFFIPNADKNRKILLPFYEKDTLVYNTLTNNESFEKIKFLSSIYPYSSTIASAIKGILISNKDSLNGFIPAEGIIDTTGLTAGINATFSTPGLPAEKFIYLKHIIERCSNNNIKVIVVSSPVFHVNSNQEKMASQFVSFCRQYKELYYFDYTKYEKTYEKVALFKDNSHLNYDGAQVFSKAFANDFRKVIMQ